jgi:hypothetical protein
VTKAIGKAIEMVEEIDRAFAPIADAVTLFASRKQLAIEKCPRGNAGWELTQPHELGGKIAILLLYNPLAGLGIGSVWQFPCADTSLLYAHFRSMHACALDESDVIAALDNELREIKRVRFGYWTNMSPLPAAN